LRAWLSQEPQLGTPALRASAAGGDPDLALVSAWNDDANRCIAEMCTLVPAFPGAREALALAATVADLMVVSQAPHANLVHEWGGAGFTQYVGLIAGQESGTKARQLARAAEGRYAPDHMLMVGDAPGDLVAARENGCIFYPIIPGYEAASWTRFREEALPRFIGGTFDAAYQQGLMVEFEAALPCTPPWSHRADTEGP
jgi:phosphoglycolate phosphatase-like HAD superfamily hydrolase